MTGAAGARWLLAALVLLLLVTGAAIFSGPWLRPVGPASLPACPYLESREISSLPPEVAVVIGSYEAIRETLKRNSLEGVAAQAEAIAAAFAADRPVVAACAKRLAAERDVESARRAFLRLNRLMEKHARSLPAK